MLLCILLCYNDLKNLYDFYLSLVIMRLRSTNSPSMSALSKYIMHYILCSTEVDCNVVSEIIV